MIVEKVDPSREAFSDYALDGAVLTVAGIPVNLEEEQGDQEVIITFAACNGKVHRGMMPCCQYVADVIIPPRKYETVEADGPPANAMRDDEKKDEVPEKHTETLPVPLDTDSVTLKLWPVAVQSEISHQQGENNAAE
ncbi:MAG: hypothetical protein LBF74_09075 [Treponema sp.]|jgi:hypothetical protein|nr:hypothetical protein [Treponema sp.]